jgi:hypothetical protein
MSNNFSLLLSSEVLSDHVKSLQRECYVKTNRHPEAVPVYTLIRFDSAPVNRKAQENYGFYPYALQGWSIIKAKKINLKF